VLADPEVRLSLTGRSGPLVVEIEYRVAQENARAFHGVMQEVQLSRQRNGAYGWSIARDIADPELWTERYHCPTWFDYLRQRNRSTQSERALHQRAMDFHLGPDPVRVRRMLERPFGSVRWKEDTPDSCCQRGVAGRHVRRQQHVIVIVGREQSERTRNDSGLQFYCPCSARTFAQTLLSRSRFCFRHSRTTWSLSLM
jgi:hypothetical protein